MTSRKDTTGRQQTTEEEKTQKSKTELDSDEEMEAQTYNMRRLNENDSN